MSETTPVPIRALIIDDHRLFNDGLKSMLADEPTVEVVGQVYESKDTVYAVARFVPDILLMDFNMPGINGLDMTRLLLHNSPSLKILILSMYAEQRYIDDFKKAGARGYLLKTADVDEVILAIQAIHAGQLYFEGRGSRLTGPDPHAEDNFMRRFRLTQREIEVVEYIRQGLTNQQIAAVMNVSFFTIETHRRNIYLKVGVKSTADLIRFITENNS